MGPGELGRLAIVVCLGGEPCEVIISSTGVKTCTFLVTLGLDRTCQISCAAQDTSRACLFLFLCTTLSPQALVHRILSQIHTALVVALSCTDTSTRGRGASVLSSTTQCGSLMLPPCFTLRRVSMKAGRLLAQPKSWRSFMAPILRSKNMLYCHIAGVQKRRASMRCYLRI